MVSELHPSSSVRFKKKKKQCCAKKLSVIAESLAEVFSSSAATTTPSFSSASAASPSFALLSAIERPPPLVSILHKDLFFVTDICKGSAVKLEWNPSLEPFHFGSFGFLDLHREEEDAPTDEDKDTEVQVAPVIKLEEVALSTGEEDDEPILNLKTKLHVPFRQGRKSMEGARSWHREDPERQSSFGHCFRFKQE